MTTHLKRAVLCTIAYTLDSTEIEDLRDTFMWLDRTKNGTISLLDFSKWIKSFNRNITTEEIRRIFNCVDHDHHGCIEYSEFVWSVLETTVGLSDDLIHDAFEKFDHEHKGFLTAQNLEAVLGETFEDTRVKDFINEVQKEDDELHDHHS